MAQKHHHDMSWIDETFLQMAPGDLDQTSLLLEMRALLDELAWGIDVAYREADDYPDAPCNVDPPTSFASLMRSVSVSPQFGRGVVHAILDLCCGVAGRQHSLHRSPAEMIVGWNRFLMTLLESTWPAGDDLEAEAFEEVLGRVAAGAYDTLALWHILPRLRQYRKKNPPSGVMKKHLSKIVDAVGPRATCRANRDYISGIRRLMGETRAEVLDRDDHWATVALDEVNAMDRDAQTHWVALINHAAKAATGTPTDRWLSIALDLLLHVNKDDFAKHAIKWFELTRHISRHGISEQEYLQRRDLFQRIPEQGFREHFLKLGAQAEDRSFFHHVEFRAMNYAYQDGGELYKELVMKLLAELRESDTPFTDRNSDVLKGLVWFAGLVDDDSFNRSFCKLAQLCYRMIPTSGPVAAKVGNACFYALGVRATESSLALLDTLASKIKNKSAQKFITQAMNAAADKMGASQDELANRARQLK